MIGNAGADYRNSSGYVLSGPEFLAATAYVDGSRPSIIMARGYYTRAVIAAWDFRGG